MNQGPENNYTKASQTVNKAGQAVENAMHNASGRLGSFFERHAQLQGWLMLGFGILIILHLLNVVSFMRYIFLAAALYLILYGMYKSQFIDYLYSGYRKITSFFDKKS